MNRRDDFLQKASHDSRDRYKVWLEQARYDLETAKNTLHHGSYEWVCYQSIQCVEKALKAVIVHAGYRPPMTHKLGVLVSISNRSNPNFLNIKLNFRKIEGYTFISRYPFLVPGRNVTPHEIIQKRDAETCLELATEMYSKIHEFIEQQSGQYIEGVKMEDYYFTEEEIKVRKADVVQDILQANKLKVKKIILFGGFARESTRPRSTTMDILVVADTDLPFIERIQYLREASRGDEPIIEPLVYTPAEFEYMLKEEGEGFLESAIDEGVVLWEEGK